MNKPLKVAVIGGGPGGMYFSILLKKHIPSAVIDIYEQNKNDDAFGFGVVFSDETLSEYAAKDEVTYEAIRQSFAYWDSLDVSRNGEVVRILGNGFCGCSRKTLLTILHQRCAGLGIPIHFSTQVNPSDELEADLIVIADGINSGFRTAFEKEFGTVIEWKNNRFVWLGSTRPLDAFTYFFRQTNFGAFVAHTYQYEKGHSTWVIECSHTTFQNAGFTATDEAGTIQKLSEIFKEELQGHPLIGNKSYWRQFPYIVNKNWSYENRVLLGDAKASAHFSIGSGTKLAMDCAIGLAEAVIQNPDDREKAFLKYNEYRRNPVERIQHAANVSLGWFENLDRHMKLPFPAFSFSLMSRSAKITIGNQRRRDARYANFLVADFNKSAGTADENTPPAFTPFSIGSVKLVNRIAMSPMGQYKAVEGKVSPWHLVHYGSRAVGGVGLILTEMTAVTPEGRITPGCPGIWNDQLAEEWKKITDFIHQQSQAKIGMQLGHCGRKGSCEILWKAGKDVPLKNNGWPLIAPSAMAYKEGFAIPKAMDSQDMAVVKNAFAEAAKRTGKANFDLIELQAHHGFLLGTFISPLTNQRTDAYGGSLENRMKYPLEILKEIKKAVSIPVSVRISASDWAEGGTTIEEAIQAAKLFHEAGASIINVSSGGTVAHEKAVIGRLWQTPLADAIRNTAGVPTITAGQIQDIDQINTLLINQRADVVALGRPLLINASFVRHAQAETQFRVDGVNAPDTPPPYKAGLSYLYPYQKKASDELEEMKLALKPKSHQIMKMK